MLNIIIFFLIFCFCDFERILINILKQEYNALFEKDKRNIFITLAINEFKIIIDLFRFLIRFFKVI